MTFDTLPDRWSTYILADLIVKGDKINYGVVQPGEDLEVGVPLVRVGDLVSGEIDIRKLKKIALNIDAKHKKSKLIGDEILLACVGSIGAMGLANPSLAGANIARAVARIRVGNAVCREYLYWYLKSVVPQRYFIKETRTVSQPTLNIREIEQTLIPLPPLEEQRRIAAILDKADAVRRKRKEAIALTEELLRSAFLDMFGDPVTNPKGWEIATIAEVCTKVTDGTHHMPKTVENGIPILRALNIKNDKIDKSDLVYISEEDYEKISKRSPLEKGDILLTCLGTIGNVALFEEDSKFSLVRNIALLKPNYQRVTSDFLEVLLRTNYLQSQMKARAKQSSQAALYIGEIEKIRIFAPPMSLQKRFSSFSKSLRRFLQKQCQDLSTQNDVFHSLLQRAFRGEL